jgi:hypothetical protein
VPDLVVDVDGLDALVATIDRIRAGLDGTRSLVAETGPAMGSGEVASAMDHFQSHWNDGRKHIDKNAETMSSMLASAVTAYRKTDGDLAADLSSNTTTTTIGHGGRPAQ